jgi:hypothetical protein
MRRDPGGLRELLTCRPHGLHGRIGAMNQDRLHPRVPRTLVRIDDRIERCGVVPVVNTAKLTVDEPPLIVRMCSQLAAHSSANLRGHLRQRVVL